jgi:hypothetical protein
VERARRVRESKKARNQGEFMVSSSRRSEENLA